MKPLKLSRRAFAVGGAGALAALGLGGVLASDAKSALRVVMDRLLPGVVIDDESFARFQTDMWRHMNPKARVGAAIRRRFGEDVARRLPWVGPALDAFDHEALRIFFTGSDFFWLKDPRAEPVSYAGGSHPCANPFRRPTLGA